MPGVNVIISPHRRVEGASEMYLLIGRFYAFKSHIVRKFVVQLLVSYL